MKRGWTLAVVGLLAFLVLLVATLPARVLLGRIPGVTATGINGTIWSGRADSLTVQNIALGRVEWRLAVLPLLRGRLEVDAKASPSDGSGSAHCAITLQRAVSCSRLVANLPLHALQLSALPRGWSGHVQADLTELALERGWPVSARGRVDVVDIQRPTATGSSPFGSFRLELPAPNNADDNALVGALRDIGGPLEVIGTIRLSPDRTYIVDGRVAARSDADPEVARSIEYLGFPDAKGRREFSLAGSL
jgi:general secretion pathway protein N